MSIREVNRREQPVTANATQDELIEVIAPFWQKLNSAIAHLDAYAALGEDLGAGILRADFAPLVDARSIAEPGRQLLRSLYDQILVDLRASIGDKDYFDGRVARAQDELERRSTLQAQ